MGENRVVLTDEYEGLGFKMGECEEFTCPTYKKCATIREGLAYLQLHACIFET